MAHSSKLYAPVVRWAEANAEKVQSYHVEEDGGGDEEDGDWGHWVYLNEPWWCPASECGTVHEHRSKDMMRMLALVEVKPQEGEST